MKKILLILLVICVSCASCCAPLKIAKKRNALITIKLAKVMGEPSIQATCFAIFEFSKISLNERYSTSMVVQSSTLLNTTIKLPDLTHEGIKITFETNTVFEKLEYENGQIIAVLRNLDEQKVYRLKQGDELQVKSWGY